MSTRGRSRNGPERGLRLRVRVLALLAAPWLALGLHAQGTGPSDDALKMGSPPSLPAGTSREEMWPAPTAEDWAKPCLVPWQRSFEDALRVAAETNRPILACVNMDGEIASEHFAGIRYRQPETAALLEPYVCVIGSVYRHTPRDYDAEGNRVPCPRFGSVTCGEHIALETVLYDKFLDGKRIAPRHILVEQNGAKTYDVYYSWDTQTVFTAYRKGAENRPPPKPLPHGELAITERVASPDLVDRGEVESTYRRGSREVRRTLLQSALTHREVDQVDLLRLAIFGLDIDLARLARKALVQCDTEAAVDLIAEVLKVPLDEAERGELLAAAERLAQKYPRARTLLALHQGLGKSSRWVDVSGWESGAPAGGTYGPAASVESRAASAEAKPEDGPAKLELAEAYLARAYDPATERRFAELLCEDARRTALAAQALGAKGWRLDALLAVLANAKGDRDEALSRAQAAIEGGMPHPGTAAAAGDQLTDEHIAVNVLALFAQARQRAIIKAFREGATWPPEWLADVTSAYAVLVKHPLGTDANVADGYDFLRWLGATPRAVQVLEDGLARFPTSWMLHERLRGRVLWEKGPEGLEATYAQMVAREDEAHSASATAEGSSLRWFAGYASLVAAENHRRAGDGTKALAAYEHAITYYQRDRELDHQHGDSSAHYVAMARAGRARIEFEQGDLESATRELLGCFAGAPASAATLDGLNISPVDTAKMVLARLDEVKLEGPAAELRTALASLAPGLLELPAYEREVPAAPAGNSSR